MQVANRTIMEAQRRNRPGGEAERGSGISARDLVVLVASPPPEERAPSLCQEWRRKLKHRGKASDSPRNGDIPFASTVKSEEFGPVVNHLDVRESGRGSPQPIGL